MHLIHSLIYDMCAGFHQLIDHSRHILLVSGDRCCRDDDEILRGDIDLFVVIHSHSCEGAHRFALAAGSDEDDTLVLIAVHHFYVDDNAAGNVQVAQFNGGIDNVHHASAENSHLTLVADSAVDYLLDAVDI